jgi:2-dehydropantoate 2-reductase
MKIAVFGIGGVGGIVGGALAKDHPETYFYVRGDNLDAIRRNGLKVESAVFGDFTARPKLASDKAGELGVMDVIFVCCKGYSLKAACEAISPMVRPDRRDPPAQRSRRLRPDGAAAAALHPRRRHDPHL